MEIESGEESETETVEFEIEVVTSASSCSLATAENVDKTGGDCVALSKQSNNEQQSTDWRLVDEEIPSSLATISEPERAEKIDGEGDKSTQLVQEDHANSPERQLQQREGEEFVECNRVGAEPEESVTTSDQSEIPLEPSERDGGESVGQHKEKTEPEEEGAGAQRESETICRLRGDEEKASGSEKDDSSKSPACGRQQEKDLNSICANEATETSTTCDQASGTSPTTVLDSAHSEDGLSYEDHQQQLQQVFLPQKPRGERLARTLHCSLLVGQRVGVLETRSRVASTATCEPAKYICRLEPVADCRLVSEPVANPERWFFSDGPPEISSLAQSGASQQVIDVAVVRKQSLDSLNEMTRDETVAPDPAITPIKISPPADKIELEEANKEEGETRPSLTLNLPVAAQLSGTVIKQQDEVGQERAMARQMDEDEEDDDLEREFDEEPEFERRQVVVRRGDKAELRQEYLLGDELGRGRFGTVCRCVEQASGRQLAAKFIHMRRKEDRDDVEREVVIMSLLQHKRLLQLYDAFDDGANEMCLITELIEGGELFERIVDDDFDLTERKAAIFVRQICEGVEYMHSQRVVHLDMKPENILCISRTGNRIKLIDFGLARQLKPKEELRVMFGTPDFAAPEVLTYDLVSLYTDMWSVGVICYVLLSGLSPFMGDNDMETMANVTRATYDFDNVAFEPISELAKDFISKLLVRDPEKRLRPDQCLKHAWLQRGGAKLKAAVRERRRSSIGLLLLEGRHQQAVVLQALDAQSGAGNQATTAIGSSSPGADEDFSLLTLNATTTTTAASTPDTISSMVSLDKRNLKKYVVRRKWHKTVHAIMALGRMGANLRLKL